MFCELREQRKQVSLDTFDLLTAFLGCPVSFVPHPPPEWYILKAVGL